MGLQSRLKREARERGVSGDGVVHTQLSSTLSTTSSRIYVPVSVQEPPPLNLPKEDANEERRAMATLLINLDTAFTTTDSESLRKHAEWIESIPPLIIDGMRAVLGDRVRYRNVV